MLSLCTNQTISRKLNQPEFMKLREMALVKNFLVLSWIYSTRVGIQVGLEFPIRKFLNLAQKKFISKIFRL